MIVWNKWKNFKKNWFKQMKRFLKKKKKKKKKKKYKFLKNF